MKRTAVVIAAAVVLVGTLPFSGSAGALAGGSAPGASVDAQSTETPANASNESLPPGARLAGVVKVQEAELEGEVESRAFGIQIARAASNQSKAGVVAQEAGAIEERLAELRERKAALREARKNGSITQAEFAAEMAGLSARTAALRNRANQTADAARGLPADVLREKGVNVSAIRKLKQDAANLTGPQVARIARSIAGPDVGRSIGGPPAGAGPPANKGPGAPAGPGGGNDTAAAERTLDRAEERIDVARDAVERARDRVSDGENATAALERAETQLSEAEAALDEARAALEAGNSTEALSLAEDALQHAGAATEHARQAIQRAGQRGGGQGDQGGNRTGDQGGQGGNRTGGQGGY